MEVLRKSTTDLETALDEEREKKAKVTVVEKPVFVP